MGTSQDALAKLTGAFEAHLDALQAQGDQNQKDDQIDEAYENLADALDRYTIAIAEEFDEELPYDVVDDSDDMELDADDINLLMETE